ncbi:MAG: hypothetical protein E2590_16660 [Chryseobacterium sp.]|nr:hypothetical protein [Chryseobacterium sp.]
MKSILQIIFLLSLTFHYSQSYFFDKELIYSFRKGKPNNKSWEMNIFINSNDNSYYLKTIGSRDNRYGIIWDLKEKKKYGFYLVNVPSKPKNYYEFQFDVELPTEGKRNKGYAFDFNQEIDENKYYIFNDITKRKNSKEVVFLKKPSDKNLFFAFLYLADEPFELIPDIEPKDNFVVEKAKISDHYYQLKSITEQSLLLEVKQ